MKTIKVSIQDEHTLMLQEDGVKGDLVDLKSLHETDIDKSNLETILEALKNEAFEAEVAKERLSAEREKALEAKIEQEKLLSRIAELEKEKEQAIAEVEQRWSDIASEVNEIPVAAQKKDIRVEVFGVAWLPHFAIQVGDQTLEFPAFASS